MARLEERMGGPGSTGVALRPGPWVRLLLHPIELVPDPLHSDEGAVEGQHHTHPTALHASEAAAVPSRFLLSDHPHSTHIASLVQKRLVLASPALVPRLAMKSDGPSNLDPI